MSLELFPAIDLRRGRVVRLHQGRFDRETTYGADPIETAHRFAAEGARWLHVVDLNAARGEPSDHLEIVARIASETPLAIELGGGLRDDAAVAAAFDAGVTRVVVGTAAVRRPEWVAELIARHPGRIVLGLDAWAGRVAVAGWEEASSWTVRAFLEHWNPHPAAAVVFTEIARDGALAGPDLTALREVLHRSRLPVVASGGVGRLEDLDALCALADEGPLVGVIVGRALYEGAFTVAEALARLEGGPRAEEA